MFQEEMLIQLQNILSRTLTNYGVLEDIKMGIKTNGVKIAEQNKIIIFSQDTRTTVVTLVFRRCYHATNVLFVFEDVHCLPRQNFISRRMLIMWDVGKARYSGLLMRDVGYCPRFWMLIYQRIMGIRLIYWCDNKLNMSFLQEVLKIVIIKGKNTFRKPLIQSWNFVIN